MKRGWKCSGAKWDFGYWRVEREIGRGWERERTGGSKGGCNGRRIGEEKGTNYIRSGRKRKYRARWTRRLWRGSVELLRESFHASLQLVAPGRPKGSVTVEDSSISAAPGTPSASCFTRLSRLQTDFFGQPSLRLVFLDGLCSFSKSSSSSSTYYAIIELKFPWLDPKWKCNGTLAFCLKFSLFSLSNL